MAPRKKKRDSLAMAEDANKKKAYWDARLRALKEAGASKEKVDRAVLYQKKNEKLSQAYSRLRLKSATAEQRRGLRKTINKIKASKTIKEVHTIEVPRP